MADRVFIDVLNGHLRAAVMRGGDLDDLFILPLASEPVPGGIYLGRVRRVLSGLNGAFVDIGTAGDGFLRAAAARHAGGRQAAASDERPRIGQLVTEGQALAVQVVRPGIEGKGPVVTTELTLAGRYAVLKGNDPGLSISRRITAAAERERLTALMAPLLDGEVGFILRTAAASVDGDAVRAEAEALRRDWQAVGARLSEGAPPALIEGGPPALLRVLREVDLDPGAEVRVEGVAEFGDLKRRIDATWPDLRVEAVPPPGGAFEAEGVAEALAVFRNPRVDLAGGGAIWVEATRALTAIDVDTGAASGRGESILDINLAAAAEVARHLRIRNVGGLIVVDFVHMRQRADRDRVVAALRAACAGDRTVVQVLGLSPLGLVEMSRERNAYAALGEVMGPL
jgi:ribonuclease E/ribonuclease G